MISTNGAGEIGELAPACARRATGQGSARRQVSDGDGMVKFIANE